MRKIFLASLLLLAPIVSWAQGNTNTVPPACTVANIATCAPAVEGTVVRMTLGADETDCTTDGGTTTVVCEYDGSAWVAVGSGGAVWTGANGETISNETDGEFMFTRNEGGAVTISCADNNDDCRLALENGGTNSMLIGNPTNATTYVEISTEGLNVFIDEVGNTFSLQGSDSDSVTLDFRDYGDTTDDDMAHVSLSTNCTTTTTNAEDCDLTVQSVENGSLITRMTIDADGNTIFPPEPTNGGMAGLQHRIVGIPKISGFSLGTGNDGSETTNVDFGDSETPNTDWTQTANITTSDNTTIWRKGSASLQMAVGASPAAGNGADNALATGDQDWSGDESFGLWVLCDTAFSAGDWVLGITDNATEDVTTGFPAYSTVNTWEWMELEIGSIADADKDVITDIAIDLSSAGATTFAAGGNCYFDGMWKWDAAEELAVGADIYEDGILSMFSVITAGAAITPILEVEDTDWFAHYETGNDFVIPITDLSADSLWGMAALE